MWVIPVVIVDEARGQHTWLGETEAQRGKALLKVTQCINGKAARRTRPPDFCLSI